MGQNNPLLDMAERKLFYHAVVAWKSRYALFSFVPVQLPLWLVFKYQILHLFWDI